jgi:hypothetical protein
MNSETMAHIESVSKMGDAPLTLHAVEKKGVARLLKENPYMGGVAVVGIAYYLSLLPLRVMLNPLSVRIAWWLLVRLRPRRVGMLTMVVPMYMSEISLSKIRGTPVVTQRLLITLGILVSYWLEYGTHFIGGVRCSPETPYTGGTSSSPAFDPYHDVPAGGCTGQSDASWRILLALQNVPALLLGGGMLSFPETPRWLLMADQGERALKSLSRLRSLPINHPAIREELLAYKADVLFEKSYAEKMYPGKTGVALAASQYYALFSSWSNFRRLAIGCCVMFFQQFMVSIKPSDM